jgi:hypothetical protein
LYSLKIEERSVLMDGEAHVQVQAEVEVEVETSSSGWKVSKG